MLTGILESLTAAALAAEPVRQGSGGGGAAQVGPWWAVLIPALPLLSFVLCGACAMFRVKGKLPAWITVAALAGSFAATVALYMDLFAGGHGAVVAITHSFDWINFRWGPGAGERFVADFAFYLDSLTVLWMLFVTGLGTLIALYASEYMAGDVGKGYARFFAAFSLFVFSMACLVMADNLLLLYLGWEGVGLCSYLLIGYFYTKPSAVAAAKKAFIVNRIGDLFLALGIMLTFVHFGSVEYAVVFERAAPYLALLEAGRPGDVPAIVQLIPLLLMVGAFGKSAQFPLYVWLPDAMEGPTPVSALIHAATMVTAGVFLICRTYGLFVLSEWALPTVAWIGTVTALLAATIGMAQFDIKRIMAYSTVSQLGYMFAGLGVLTSTGAAFHVVTHAFFKALLFLCCGAVMHGFAGQLDLRRLSGVARMPGWTIVGIGMLVGCLNLAGFPLTAGFFSKDMILAEAFTNPTNGFFWVGMILLLTAGLTAYYTFRVFFRVFVGPKHYEPGDEAHGAGDLDDGTHHDSDVAAADAAAAEEATAAEAALAAKGAAHEAGHDGHGQDGHGHDGHGHDGHGRDGHGDFHPHPPGWAINGVLAVLALCSLAASGLYFLGDHGGWVGGMIDRSSAAFASPFAHDANIGAGHAAVGAGSDGVGGIHAGDAHVAGTFFGFDPHAVMYYVSGVVGIAGIAVAYVLHLAGRTTAATSRADRLLPMLGPIARAAQRKWYVDEFYDFVVRRPLLVIAHLFHLVDQFLVDGLVNLAGWMPRGVGRLIRPSQSGELHGYAAGMAGGIAVLLIIVLLVAT